MYPVKFQGQSDVSDRDLCDSLMKKVKNVDSHILYALVSISVEMAGHLGLLRIVCYLIELPLEPLFQTVLALAHILFPTSCAGYTVYQVVPVTADVV